MCVFVSSEQPQLKTPTMSARHSGPSLMTLFRSAVTGLQLVWIPSSFPLPPISYLDVLPELQSSTSTTSTRSQSSWFVVRTSLCVSSRTVSPSYMSVSALVCRSDVASPLRLLISLIKLRLVSLVSKHGDTSRCFSRAKKKTLE